MLTRSFCSYDADCQLLPFHLRQVVSGIKTWSFVANYAHYLRSCYHTYHLTAPYLEKHSAPGLPFHGVVAGKPDGVFHLHLMGARCRPCVLWKPVTPELSKFLSLNPQHRHSRKKRIRKIGPGRCCFRWCRTLRPLHQKQEACEVMKEVSYDIFSSGERSHRKRLFVGVPSSGEPTEVLRRITPETHGSTVHERSYCPPAVCVARIEPT